MSVTNSLHYNLCVEGARWLRSRAGTEPFQTRNKYVAVELVTQAGEHTDVWGTNGYNSTVIEVKTSHEDFLRDQKKFWRSEEAEEKGYTIGNYRYYLCPAGIISTDELPKGWGLLYWTGKGVSKEVGSQRFETTNRGDICHLVSIMTREGVKNQVFNYRGKRKRN